MRHHYRKIIISTCLFILSFPSFGQKDNFPENKGKLYVLWGWNWGYYSKSDIHFTGKSYDFELANVKATDHQTPFSFHDYFDITSITIPQTNFRIGYFINDKINIAVGVDHMKYFMTNDQTVKINGYIDQTGTAYDGSYTNSDILLTKDFLSYEHSDGLNYINVELNYVKDVLSWTGHPKKKLQIYLVGGVSAGILLPKTNAKLLGRQRHDDFHLAGYGLALKTAVNISFLKYFFIQSELKGGYINMPDVRTTFDLTDRASQHFFYLMPDIIIGAIFKIANKD